MKKISFLLVCCIAVLGLKAQVTDTKPNFEFKIYGGYGMLTPGSEYETLETTSTNSNGLVSSNYVVRDYKIGQAPHFGIGAAMPLGKIFMVGLDVDYMTSNSKSSIVVSSTYTTYVEEKSHVLSFIPNITYKFNSSPKYSIYNTLGLVVAANTKLHIDFNGTNSLGQSGDVQDDKFGVNVGFKDAIGVKFWLAKNLQGFAEASGFFLAQSVSQRILTFRSSSGSDTQTFKSSGTSTGESLYSGSVDSYQEATENPYHFSSIGLNIGIIYRLK